MPAPYDPLVHYSTARGYIEGVKCILLCQGVSPSMPIATFLSRHLLLGFALELYFKSWLQHKGVEEKILRARKVRHNLSDLHVRCLQTGLFVPKLKRLADSLQAGHAEHHFRYLQKEGMYPNTDFAKALIIIERLDNIIDAEIGASAHYGLEVGRTTSVRPLSFKPP